MKLSVSVPDDLWAALARPEDSPSELVQKALNELLRQRRPTGLFGRAPSEEVREDVNSRLQEAVERLRSNRLELREAGYRAGIQLVNDGFFDDLNSFRYYIDEGDPETTALELNEGIHDETLVERICELALSLAGLGFSRGDSGCGLAPDFMSGLAAALHDIWDASGEDRRAAQ